MDKKVRELMASPEGQQLNRDLLAGRKLSPEAEWAKQELRRLERERAEHDNKPES